MDDFFEALAAHTRRQIVILTAEEMEKATSLGQKRNGKEKQFGSMTYDKRLSGDQAHRIGVLAEWGAARFFGMRVDERIFSHCGDDGIDLDGDCKLGVKCSTYFRDPLLRVEIHHHKPGIDGYVLCAINPEVENEVHLIGWATPKMVEAGVQKQLMPNGPMNYVLCEHELLDIQSLKDRTVSLQNNQHPQAVVA